MMKSRRMEERSGDKQRLTRQPESDIVFYRTRGHENVFVYVHVSVYGPACVITCVQLYLNVHCICVRICLTLFYKSPWSAVWNDQCMCVFVSVRIFCLCIYIWIGVCMCFRCTHVFGRSECMCVFSSELFLM